MSDGISPLIQFGKSFLSERVTRMVRINFRPKLDTKKPEIGSDATGLSILVVELTPSGESRLDEMMYQCRRFDACHQTGHAFGMKVTTESLKL